MSPPPGGGGNPRASALAFGGEIRRDLIEVDDAGLAIRRLCASRCLGEELADSLELGRELLGLIRVSAHPLIEGPRGPLVILEHGHQGLSLRRSSGNLTKSKGNLQKCKIR